MSDRFVVRQVSGWSEVNPAPTHLPEGLTVVVLDAAYNYAMVGMYRSEDHRKDGDRRKRIGRDGAIAAATAQCELLNAA